MKKDKQSSFLSSHPENGLKKDSLKETPAWIFYFDKLWASKLKKLKSLLNNLTK